MLVFIEFPAIPRTYKPLSKTATPSGEQCALCIGGFFGDDIDRAIDRISAPDCGTWTADDFNTLYIFYQSILLTPDDPGE